MIITPVDPSESIDTLRTGVKNVWTTKPEMPVPSDVITTKGGQLIVKFRNRREAMETKDSLSLNEDLIDKIKVNVPYRKREWILLLSVDPLVTEEQIDRELGKLLGDAKPGSLLGQELKERLKDPALTVQAKKILEDMYLDQKPDFRIVRKITTKAGNVNWILDVDDVTKEWLLFKKRICINFERYRVAEYINIIRCYKCQEFGHMSTGCKNPQRCLKCSEDHRVIECKTDKELCANCYFADATCDGNQRADSVTCPVFQNYRQSLLPKRL